MKSATTSAGRSLIVPVKIRSTVVVGLLEAEAVGLELRLRRVRGRAPRGAGEPIGLHQGCRYLGGRSGRGRGGRTRRGVGLLGQGQRRHNEKSGNQNSSNCHWYLTNRLGDTCRPYSG